MSFFFVSSFLGYEKVTRTQGLGYVRDLQQLGDQMVALKRQLFAVIKGPCLVVLCWG